MPKVTVTVAIPDPKAFDTVMKAARETGFSATGRFEELGLATGEIDAEKVAALRKLPGVESVEAERQYTTPRPV